MYSVSKKEEVFKDPTLTGTIVDRLAHRAHIMDMSREKSYRMEDTMEWSKNLWAIYKTPLPYGKGQFGQFFGWHLNQIRRND